jgi:hypothetical protein
MYNFNVLMLTKDNDNFPPFHSAINLYIKLFEPAPLLIYVRSVCTTYQKGGGVVCVAIYASLLREKHRNIESASDGA